MSHLLLLLTFSINLVKRTVQQNTVCVWNSKNEWDHLNGEYDLQSDTTYNGYPYWKQTATPSSTDTCPETPFYIFAGLSTADKPYWTLHNVPSTQYTYGYPDCDDVYDNYPFPSDPTQCAVGYYIWAESFSSIREKLPLTVTVGSCPTLPCDEIRISNTLYTECDQTFVADVSRNNVFVHDSMYFFFNQYSFRWGCDNDLYQLERCDGDISTSTRMVDTAEWIDVSVGSSISIGFVNGNDVALECIKTIDPTYNPITSDSTTSDPTTSDPTTSDPTDFTSDNHATKTSSIAVNILQTDVESISNSQSQANVESTKENGDFTERAVISQTESSVIIITLDESELSDEKKSVYYYLLCLLLSLLGVICAIICAIIRVCQQRKKRMETFEKNEGNMDKNENNGVSDDIDVETVAQQRRSISSMYDDNQCIDGETKGNDMAIANDMADTTQ